MQPNTQYRIEVIRDIVPESIKPYILLSFFLIFQFSGGIYLAAVSQVSGALSLMHEDIMMAGFATLVGLCLTFTIMYRLKFRFTVKTGLLASAAGLIVCNMVCLYTGSIPVMVGMCFFAGIFRMWGTFMCNTTLAPWLFPKWTMPKFQCYIQATVMGFMLLSGLTTTYITYYFQWQYMHWLVLGLLLTLLLLTSTIFRHHMPMKRLPLYGIDWMGAILIGITALCIIFVLNYGHYYDWFESPYIWAGTIFGVLALSLNIWRASFIRHPYVENQTWTYRPVWTSLLLLFAAYILSSPSSYLEQVYTSAILEYDEIHRIRFNWISLCGYICAALFAYQTLALRKWKFKTLTAIAFSLVVGYLAIMYFIIDYNIPQEALYLPVFLRSAGMLLLPITFLSCIFQTIPFNKFFQALDVVTLVTACCGPLLGSALLTHIFERISKSNGLFLGSTLDRVNHAAASIPPDSLYWKMQQQSMLVGMKEIYGWLCIAGIACLLAFMLRESSLRPKNIYQSLRKMRRGIKHDIKMEQLANN